MAAPRPRPQMAATRPPSSRCPRPASRARVPTRNPAPPEIAPPRAPARRDRRHGARAGGGPARRAARSRPSAARRRRRAQSAFGMSQTFLPPAPALRHSGRRTAAGGGKPWPHVPTSRSPARPARSRSPRSAPGSASRRGRCCPTAMTRPRSPDFIDGLQDRPDGKLVLVTAINPTPAGEGKTTTTVGLGDGLNRIGRRAASACASRRLGPCFGMKGGAAGGGCAQVVPMEDINLHFTGDFHAIRRRTTCCPPCSTTTSTGATRSASTPPDRLAPGDGHERPRPAPDRRRRSAAWPTASRARTASTSPSPPR
ncbi:MAG: hypothetical protein KatS3mg118_1940 [Paracoccaceae bacterium]|nr:MAG: hypothetical protein KatS3mg118_1940 [Paracoccaceae bacterium]